MVGSVKRIFSTRVRAYQPFKVKVINFCTNRKRVCDFLSVIVTLALSCTVSEILQVFAPHPYSTVIWRMFPLDEIANVEVNPSIYPELISLEIIFEYSNLCIM